MIQQFDIFIISDDDMSQGSCDSLSFYKVFAMFQYNEERNLGGEKKTQNQHHFALTKYVNAIRESENSLD